MAQILRGKIRWAERQLYHDLERMRPLSLKLWEKGDLEATLATRRLGQNRYLQGVAAELPRQRI
jgi:hypothetical protein